MGNLKIVLIGGGSYTWGPKIVTDIVLEKSLEGSEIILHDINEEALDLIYSLEKKVIEKTKKDFSLKKTTDLAEALKGADFVILTISTGGLDMMRHDLEIPLKYGIYQSVGDTVGPGGLSRALRNIPVVLNIGRQMEKLCPNAWMINYTNPMSTLCRTLTKYTRIKTIGLCHELFDVVHTLKRIFNVEDSEIYLQVGGINHFTWITQLRVKGKDGFLFLHQYLEEKEPELKKEVEKLDWEKFDPYQDNNLLKFELFKIFGCLPAAGDRHVAEFFPYFLTDETRAGREYGIKLTTIEDRLASRKEKEELIKNTLKGKTPLRIEPSFEKAAKIIVDLAGYGEGIHIMNLPNKGQISDLPQDVIVETLGVVNGSGVYPICVDNLPRSIIGILYRHIINQELIVEAGVKGDKNLALQALVNDPLVPSWEKAKKILDELLEATSDYLPQF
ncbi:alpha-glucosidase/alpha-galactosidase [Candidatus Aerophobetes bacterium]|nr:alpha-glucosidase/alpha-galactosidase [Candidatus Aerophobetes bacterium]